MHAASMATESDTATVHKLTEACFQSLITSPVDPRKLYDLSTDELVALNTKLLTNYQTVEQDLARLKARRYHVDPPEVQERVGAEMQSRAMEATNTWQPVSIDEAPLRDMTSITNMDDRTTWLHWDSNSGKASYRPIGDGRNPYWEKLGYCSVISSALLMYRLCCLFKCQVDVEGPDGYKLVWSIYLKHKASGIYVGFSEWKGSPSFLSNKFPPTGTTFDDDWLALLNLLLDPQCPHPYDGTVAGSVA